MSIKIMSAVWDGGPKGPTKRFVLVALADNANDDGECWPSIASISRKTGLCERVVRSTIRQLEAEGWMSTELSAGKKGCNKYRLTPAPHAPGITCPPAYDAPTPGTTCPPTPAPHAPEPSITTKEPSEKKPAPEARAILEALGAVVSRETAEAFIAHRKAKRSALSAYAASLIAKKLTAHPDPDSVLLASIENGWTGVFPEKSQAKGEKNGQTPRRQFDAAINETARRLSEGTIHLDYSSRDPFAAR